VLVVTAFALALVFVVGISTKCRTPPAKAGGSKRKLRGLPTLVRSKAKWKGRSASGGLHKRSAEDWGSGLRARGGWPLAISLVGKVRFIKMVAFRNRGVVNWNKFTPRETLLQADFTLPIEMLYVPV